MLIIAHSITVRLLLKLNANNALHISLEESHKYIWHQQLLCRSEKKSEPCTDTFGYPFLKYLRATDHLWRYEYKV
jgi:hypothetical protein